METIDFNKKSIFDAPPKKKKKYVLFLSKMDSKNQEKIKMMEKIIQRSIKEYILVRFEDPDEGLKALLLKNIEMIILDSSFFKNDAISIEYAIECKKRKKCPILFTTQSPEKLIEDYRRELYLYEEFDNYFKEPLDPGEFAKKLIQTSKIKSRQAKRFSMNIPITLFRLNTEKIYPGILNDMSLVGLGITLKNQDIFSKEEQFQIKIPLEYFHLFHPNYGEYLKLSTKLKRLSISGNVQGMSFEHLTQNQIEIILAILTKIHSKYKQVNIPQTNNVQKRK
jgi:hypothetical protein